MTGRRTSRGLVKGTEVEQNKVKLGEFKPVATENGGGIVMSSGTATPPLSQKALNGLSSIRKGQLNSVYGAKDATMPLAHHGIKKEAGCAGATANTVRMGPEVYSPLYNLANLNLPRDRITTNAWARNFFLTHPIVHNSINLHATYPISKINIKCKDKKVEQFFNDMAEDLNLMQIISDAALDYWMLGESFVFMELDKDNGVWKRGIIQNPDYIVCKKSVIAGEPVIYLRPDAVLQRIAVSNDPTDIQLRQQIPEDVLHYIRKGEAIPLPNFNISHVKRLASPTDVRGTSIITSVFKDLMLYDKLRESKYAQADNLINPITHIKLGGSGEGEYHPSQNDIDQWRNTFEEAQYDKDFKIISHAAVDISRIGASGQLVDIASDMELILNNIYAGLMTPKVIIDSEGPTYSSGSIGLEVLRGRYGQFRTMMSDWLVSKIFAPISYVQGFYEYESGRKKLIVPEIEWNHMNLYDMDSYVTNISGLVDAKKVSLQTLYRSLGLNYEDERRKIRQETIDEIILMKEQNVLENMSLAELRTIDTDTEIIEPSEGEMMNDLAGAGGMDGMGGDLGLGGGGMELGGAPGGDMGGDIGGGLGGAPGGDIGGGMGGAPGAGAPPEGGGGL